MDAKTVLLFVAALCSGGVFQFASSAFKRRGEIRNLDTDADSKAVTSAGVIMDRLEKAVARGDEQVSELGRQLHDERIAHTRQLNAAHAEIGRLGGQVASLRVDLSIANQHIEQLRVRLVGRMSPGETTEIPPR